MTLARAVICDDDALVRSVIRQVLDDSAIDVVAEAESPEDALDFVRDLSADILILDLALRGGNGEKILQHVRESGSDVKVVVYSSYAADPARLIDSGATAVVEKPDFARLYESIDEIVAGFGMPADRRRPGARELGDLSPPTALSISGFEPWQSLLTAAADMAPGDGILAMDIVPGPSMRDAWDDVFSVDHRVALGRALATGRRSPDRVSLSPSGRPVLLLMAGHAEAPTAVFRRVTDRWAREVAAGTPVGAFGLVRSGDDATARLDEVIESVKLDRTEPLRMV